MVDLSNFSATHTTSQANTAQAAAPAATQPAAQRGPAPQPANAEAAQPAAPQGGAVGADDASHDAEGDSGMSPLYLLYGFLMLAGLLLCGWGVDVYRRQGDYLLLGFGALGVIMVTAMFPIAVALARGVPTTSGQSNASDKGASPEDAALLLRSINDRLLISDTAKRIAFRERDRATLREAIRADIAKNDFEAALVLVDDMSKLYGYREEAETFRSEILAARDAMVKENVKQAIGEVEQLIAETRWADAVREASKIQRLYSEMEETRGLLGKVREARDRHKEKLMAEFYAAKERDDIETAWELLKELDNYLTQAEAVPLQEHARVVIAKKRDMLGVRFRLAVQEQEWHQALRTAEQIIAEFPHSKMAEEVQQRLGSLRELAEGRGTAAGASQISAWEWAQQAGG